ncbi:DUF6092 family protein [Amycolatopsis jejuensis]|uniref:DUF6092 family protein n=1 Tax=Amycolatopsis jejuensis TaxID=330084 RepID=UPI000527DDFC|nr:DUF6092 family protein [Amycolatopsis jejuensis]
MDAKIEERLFEVVAAMFAAAPTLQLEPRIHAAWRVSMWGGKLLAILEEFGQPDDFVSDSRKSVNENSISMISDPAKFTVWADEISAKFVAEAKRRNIAAADASSSDHVG